MTDKKQTQYRVTVFNDCHSAHNTRIYNLSHMEAEGIRKMLKKERKLFTIKPMKK